MATTNYTLQILHASDLEAANTALSRMPQFAAIIDKLDDQYANTLKLIAGDAWIPGPFYAAEGDSTLTAPLRAALAYAGAPAATTATAASTRVSVAFMDLIGVQVASFGNHEFDGGTGPINDALGVANFPYLSANYDFTADPNLRTRVTADGQEASTIKGRIAGSAVVTINGERIGVVGDTTQLLASISSPGAVTSKTGPAVDDMPALARVLQPYIDALTARGIDKIVLTSHLQQYQLEQALVPLLKNVDIVVSAGSHAVFADSTDILRPGDTAQSAYPTVLRDALNNPVLQVNTQNEYGYVGRLVATFDPGGVIIPSSVDPNVSGAFITTDAGVASLYGSADPYAAGSYGAAARALLTPIGNVIASKDGNIQGFSRVFLDGNRVTVRQQESNLGDLSADANLFVARQVDPATVVSIKNGGGIRDVIGSYTTDALSRPIPTQANPAANKPATAVSQLDIENSLRFNNNLSLVTITAQQLKQVMEFGATLVQPGLTPGGFVQVGGLNVSYDTTRTAQVLNVTGTPTTQGDRVRNLAVVNDDGTLRDVIVANGVVVGDPSRPIRVVTLDFIANSTGAPGTLGGDSNPLAAYATNKVTLTNNPALGAGLATFSAPGTEQDAMAEYLKARFSSATAAYGQAETDPSLDQRIQVLSARPDNVILQGGGAVSGLSLGYGERAGNVIRSTLAYNGFVLDAPDAASLGSGAPNQSNVARLSNTSAATQRLPTGFKAGVLANSGTLVGQGTDYLLVGAQAGSTLVAQTGGSNTVVGGAGGAVMFGGTGSTTFVGGDGNDTVVAGSGSSVVYTGGGTNLVGLDGGSATVVSEGVQDVIVGGSGSALVGVARSAIAYNGGGVMTFVGGSERSTVVGGSGSNSVFGGAGGGLFTGGTAGRNLLVAGAGQAVLIGGGDGDVLYAGGSGGTLLTAAASGNATLAAGSSTGANTYFAGGGTNLLAGGIGNEVFFAGSGTATIIGGRGADVFAVSNGRAGGTITVADFTAAEGDRISLQGYGPNAVQQAVATASASAAGSTITLSDGTRVTFQGVGSLQASNFA